MPHVALAVLVVAVAGATFEIPVLAQKPSTPAPTGARFNACTILSREEVRKIFPWTAEADRDKEVEMTVDTGSACVYPSVQFVVDKYSASKIERARKDGPMTPVAGIGDEALIQQKGKYWVELYIKHGDRLVHVEKDIVGGSTLESVKPSMVALGRALISKLR